MYLHDTLLLNKRINVKYSINDYKQNKRCQLRYGKYIKSFNFFVNLTLIRILINKSTIYFN